MQLSTWIILIIVISLIIGPLAALRPSPAQKRREQLRLFARTQGLAFTRRAIPDGLNSEAKDLVFSVYFVAPKPIDEREDWFLFRANYEHELHWQGVWAWAGKQKASADEANLLREYLKEVPDSVHAFSGGRGGYCIYWTEQGDDKLVASMAQLLKKMQQL